MNWEGGCMRAWVIMGIFIIRVIILVWKKAAKSSQLLVEVNEPNCVYRSYISLVKQLKSDSKQELKIKKNAKIIVTVAERLPSCASGKLPSSTASGLLAELSFISFCQLGGLATAQPAIRSRTAFLINLPINMRSQQERSLHILCYRSQSSSELMELRQSERLFVRPPG